MTAPWSSAWSSAYGLGIHPDVHKNLLAKVFNPSGDLVCTTTITWDSQAVPVAEITVQDYNSSEVLFASGPSGVQDAPWIQASPHSYTFRLYDKSTGVRVLVDSIVVTASGAPVGGSTYISASPNPCTITAGALITTWVDILEPPTFSWIVNGGLSECTVKLPRGSGNVGEPGEGGLDDVKFGNVVKFYVVDEEDNVGVLIYQGIIDDYTIDDGANVTEVKLVPKTSIVQDLFIRGPIEFTYLPSDEALVVESPADPADMIKWFINHNYFPGVTYDTAGSQDFGTAYEAVFQKEKLQSILDRIQQLVGGMWFYRFNPDNTLSFNHWNPRIPADHTLYIGKHLSNNIKFHKTRFDVKYRVYVFGADEQRDSDGIITQERIEAEVHEANYDPTVEPRDLFYTNSRITDYATALRIGTALLEASRKVSFETEVTVIDNNADYMKGYDIESFVPGQTVSIVNPSMVYERRTWGDGHIWGDGGIWGYQMNETSQLPLIIAEVDYNYFFVTLKLQSRPTPLPEELVNVSDRLLVESSA